MSPSIYNFSFFFFFFFLLRELWNPSKQFWLFFLSKVSLPFLSIVFLLSLIFSLSFCSIHFHQMNFQRCNWNLSRRAGRGKELHRRSVCMVGRITNGSTMTMLGRRVIMKTKRKWKTYPIITNRAACEHQTRSARDPVTTNWTSRGKIVERWGHVALRWTLPVSRATTGARTRTATCKTLFCASVMSWRRPITS